jgi:hypothetical protein
VVVLVDMIVAVGETRAARTVAAQRMLISVWQGGARSAGGILVGRAWHYTRTKRAGEAPSSSLLHG